MSGMLCGSSHISFSATWNDHNISMSFAWDYMHILVVKYVSFVLDLSKLLGRPVK